MPTNGKLVRTTVLLTESQMKTVRGVFLEGQVLSQSEGLRYIINKYAEMKATGLTG